MVVKDLLRLLLKMVKKEIKKEISKQAEDKYIIVNTSPLNTIPITMATTCLNLCGQGTDVFNRVGNVVKAKLLELRYYIDCFTPMLASGTAGVNVRVMIVKDRLENQSAPVYNDIFTNVNEGPLSVTNLQNFYINKRFQTIYDKTHALEYLGGTVANPSPGGKSTYFGVIRKKLKGNIYYANTTNAQTSIGKNAYYFLVVSDNVNAANYQVSSQLTFEDC